jgi:hypothetical protein
MGMSMVCEGCPATIWCLYGPDLSMCAAETTLMCLPDNLLERIFDGMEVRHSMTCSAINRRWRALTLEFCSRDPDDPEVMLIAVTVVLA